MNLLKEIKSLYCFCKQTPKADKLVVFYAEHKNYFPYFEGLIEELVNKYNQSLCYVTSDPNDPILQNQQPKIKAYYLDKLLPLFMVFVNCKVFIMTLTDLNQFHLKRSINSVHYLYVFHSLVSTHMIYRLGAFDYYDSILCVGSHQIKEVRKHEELYGLKPKNLIEAGYYRLESLYKDYLGYKKEGNKVSVLVAPTWGSSSLLGICGKELLKILLDGGYDVTLRLHPETVKRKQFEKCNGVILETSITNMDSLVKADILITDWSGIGIKYAFGTERPVIFIDTPPKVNNPQYMGLGIEPLGSFLRDKIGIIVPLKELDTIPKVISILMLNALTYKKDIVKLREKYVYAFGHSVEVGAQYIKDLVK